MSVQAAVNVAASVAPAEPAHGDETSIGSFIDYKRVVLSLSGDLKRLRGFAGELDLNETIGLIDEVLHRIENDSFTVAVVGEFKRGKSTFINALLGVDVLPTDVLPCSATLNRVSYSLTPRVVVAFKDDRREEVEINRLADFVTKLTNDSEEVAKTVKEAIIYYPSPYCQNNVDVYDTPGLNDDAAMTEVTLSILPKIDAAIMVILAQAPFGEFERDFLENRLLAADLSRVIFVVNGIDNFNRPEDADRIVHAIEDRIQRHVVERAKRQFGADSPEYETYVKKIGRPRVFGLSAYQAVVAKQSNDPRLLEKSRFPQFERELQRLLTERRGAVTLQVPANRIIWTCREILDVLTLRREALSLRRDDFEAAYQGSEREIQAIRERKSSELERVHRAGERTIQVMAPLVEALPEALMAAAGKAVDEAVIEPKELDRSDQLKEGLGKLIDNAIRRESDTQGTMIQVGINEALADEVERLSSFDDLVGGLMGRIKVNFGALSTEESVGGRAEAAAAAVAVFTGLGGVWGGYRQAGWKGAGVGAAVSVGTAFAAGIVLAVLAVPIGLPVIIGIGLASILPGSLAARFAFPKDRVEHFRASYKKAVLEELRQALRQVDLKYQVHEHVQHAFAELRDRVRREVDAALLDAEQTLITLRARYERESTLSEAERENLASIEQSTRAIGASAERLSRQLVQILEI